MENKTYKLFAALYSPEAVEEAENHRFNRINGRYVLIYEGADKLNTNKTVYHIISEDETGYLSGDEKAWLLECNVQIITEESLKNQDKILESFSEKLDLLEQELKQVSEEVKHEDKHGSEQ